MRMALKPTLAVPTAASKIDLHECLFTCRMRAHLPSGIMLVNEVDEQSRMHQMCASDTDALEIALTNVNARLAARLCLDVILLSIFFFKPQAWRQGGILCWRSRLPKSLTS